MNAVGLRNLKAVMVLLFAGLSGLAPPNARGQFAGVLDTNSRYAGNSTGTNLYNGDTGAANSISLNAPSYAVFDSLGNLYVADTANNCVRKIDTSGNVATVAGLRVNGGPDTCNTSTNATPTPAEGLLAPTGLAIDSANTLYIADSQHNCVRSLASGAVDSYAANALTTVAGTCTSVDTASVTPAPNGLAVDGSSNLYISIQDSAAVTPVNQVVRHLVSDPATTVCYMAGQPSTNVPNACAGVTGTVTLSSPAGLAFDVNGNLFIADTGNNCVREIAGLTTQQTAVGLCANDSTGNAATTLYGPYGLAFSPGASLYISETAPTNNNVVSFSPGAGTLTLVAGLPNGTAGSYSAALDGQSSLSAPLDAPLGLTTDASGNIYLADSLNNVVREMSTGLDFSAGPLGTPSAAQTITFSINQAVDLSATAGPDYSIASTTCNGPLSAAASGAPPNTCQVVVTFTPTRPGVRDSALQLKDSVSNSTVSVALEGMGTGPLSLLTPGTVSSIATGLRTPIAVSVDSTGNAYVLEQGDGLTTADVIRIPAGGSAAQIVVPQGGGLITPTAMALDGAGNLFIADGSLNSVIRIGADGSVNTSYVTGLVNATALAVDGSDNLYIAQSGTAHNVIEVYAGGTRRVVAGSGATANADGVPATSALFAAPSGLALGPNGLSIADASGHLVYTIDGAGVIHIVAGNGTTITTTATQATGTGLLLPVGLATDAAGDLYIADQAANRIYEVYPITSNGANISSPLGTGTSGYGGDGGPATSATLRGPLTVGLDGSGDLFVVDAGNSAVREAAYSASSNLDFGHVIIGTASPVMVQSLGNAGNAGLTLTTPFTTTDSHYGVSSDPAVTTCGGALAPGGVCGIGYTFTPTVLGPLPAQSNLPSNSFNSPQTVNLNGFGLYTQILPYTLTPETEVYGQPFTETAVINLVYPDLTPTGTMTYTISGETTCTTSGSFPGTVNCAASESGLYVGTYSVNFNYMSGDQSYFSTSGTTTLTVTPGALAVTPTNESKPYGAPLPALPATITGEVNGDVFLASETTTATAASPVGTYPITSTLAGVGLATLNNYNVTYNTGTLTVTPFPLTVTVASASRAYGAANPTFTGTVTGAMNGDTFTVTYSTSATATSAAGAYPVTATVTGANIGNYTVIVVPGTLTVTPIPLTVTVANASRMYDTANPTFSSTITGAINGDTFTNTYSTTATIASPVGTYPITDTLGGAAAANYTVTVVPGTLTITQGSVQLVVTANNATRAYGAANPVFTGTVTGLLNGDTVTVVYAATATAASPVGTYPITATVSGADAANYTVSVVPGTLTIAQAATSTTVATSASPVNIGTSVTFTATVTSAAGVPSGTVNFLNGTTVLGSGTLDASGVATFSTSSLTSGSYTITVTYLGATDFAGSSGTVGEIVNPGSFAITANPPSAFVRGPGSTVYTVNVISLQSFAGTVALSCSGLPADATCNFATPTLTLTSGGNASTTMTVVNTAADAALLMPTLPPTNRSAPGNFAPIAVAAVFPFEFTGVGFFLAGLTRRRRGSKRGRGASPTARLLLLLFFSVGLLGLAGCACFTSIYQNYTVTITGTSPVAGTEPQSTSVVLSVGAQ